ncbi:MAG: hypothetical protein M3040_06850 [Bacteroidota bacterium]|nr:hypothetical protein [Bacteroidota bacterium]
MKPCLIEVWKDREEPLILNMNNVISIKKDTVSRKASTVLTFSNNETFRVVQTVEEIMSLLETANQNSFCLL